MRITTYLAILATIIMTLAGTFFEAGGSYHLAMRPSSRRGKSLGAVVVGPNGTLDAEPTQYAEH